MFKPMLACDCGDTSTLAFPLLASPKLDGVRAIIRDGVVMSRSLKPIPNIHVQKLYGGLPEDIDGELIVGDPCAKDAYRKTVSVVMSEDKPIDGLKYYAFDRVEDKPFHQRLTGLLNARIDSPYVVVLEEWPARNVKELLELESKWIKRGYEGAILRKIDGTYKFGRSTRKEGYLLKLKRFADSEAEVLGVVELMHNGNEAKTNALGRTERSTHKAGKTGLNTLGALKVRDTKTGVEFEIGTGFTAAERTALWNQFQNAKTDPTHMGFLYNPIGRLAKYKYFPGGSKDKPRFPVFLGWRDRRDT